MGIIRDFLNLRKAKFMPFGIRGDYQANGSLQESDIIGAIANSIAANVGKLHPQVIRNTENGLSIRNDYLSRLLSVRWAPELDAYNALYKMAAQLVYHSNAYAVIFYNEDFTRIQSIVPVTASDVRIWEDEASGTLLFRFRWDYDKQEYTLPYQNVIHIRARMNKKRFMGSPPDVQLKNSLELLDYTGEALKNTVRNSTGLKGYLKYNNFADEEELKQKVKDFQEAYMSMDNAGGMAGLDNTMDFHEITQRSPVIPTVQSQYLRENLYRYYGINEKIITSTFTESEWNAFYESVIEPIALQLSLEFTFKLLSERERGFGNRIIFSTNRLQYATLQTRMTMGSSLFDRGVITINEYRELMYYEPIEDGDVRMVSLNYVKADDQSAYQVGADPEPAAGIEKNFCLIQAKKKGGEDAKE